MDLKHVETMPAVLDAVLSPDGERPAPATPHWLQFFPPTEIEWNTVELPIAQLPAGLHGLRILHLTDFHLRRRWPAAYDPMLARMRRDPPDLLLLTGDFVDNKRNHRPAMPIVRRLLESLTWRIGCLAIHGNHDSYDVGRELSDLPITFLDTSRRIVETPGGNVEIVGLPGKHRLELSNDFLATLPAKQAGVPRIVLSHFPDHLKRISALEPDLYLSGHTHGGQICLPGGIPLIWHDALPRRLSRGIHRVWKTWLVVSRGIGFTGLPLRVFSTPEVIEIRLLGEP